MSPQPEDRFSNVFGDSRGGGRADGEETPTTTELAVEDQQEDTLTEALLDEQLGYALDALGFDEDRGDFCDIKHDGGDHWGCKAVIDGQVVNFDVHTTSYDLNP